jgi:hypothetical protein
MAQCRTPQMIALFCLNQQGTSWEHYAIFELQELAVDCICR